MAEKKEKKEGAYASLTGFRRAVPIILAALAVFTALCFFMQDTGALGRVISSAFLGLFSYGGYLIPVFLLIHALFYPQDVKKKRTVSRVIFTIFALVTVATFIHTVTYIGTDMVFAAREFYKNGKEHLGGGLVGGAVSFALTKIFGTVGIIIIAVLILALYVTYFFAGGRSALSRLLLKILNGISDFFTAIGERKKNKKQRKLDKKKRRRIKELEEEQAPLFDDDFFAADNGMKELTIDELGIREVRDERVLEENPTLREKVFHKSDADKAESGSTPKRSFSYGEPEQPKKRVNMDYSTTDSAHGLSVSVDDYTYEPQKDDIIYNTESFSSDRNAEDVFTSGFEPFDLKLNQELMNKPSSKATAAEPEGIAEFAEPITELSEEAIEKARQRADFEMKKRAAIDAQKRYAEARAQMERERAEREGERIREEQPAPEVQNVMSKNEPYVPDYMRSEQTAPEITEEERLTHEREEIFESAISDYEREKEAPFIAYTPPTTEIFTSSPAAHEPEEESLLKMSRTMLDPTPTVDEPFENSRELYTENEAMPNEIEFEPSSITEPKLEFGGINTDDTELDFEIETSEADSPIDTVIASAPEEDAPIYDEVEIPEEEQSERVKELRKLFPFLDAEDDSDAAEETYEEDTFAPTEDLTPKSDGQEVLFEDDSKEEDELPFEYNPSPAPQKSVPTPSAPTKSAPVQEYIKPDYSDYKYPPLDLLIKGKVEEDLNQEEEKNLNAEKLVDSLLQFNVRVSIKGIDRGPRITRYEIVPARGVKVQSVTNLFNDIALNLGAEGIRMEAPIPGKSAIGVEIPNKKPSTVFLRDLVESDEFICAESKTMSCLGKDVTGNPVFADIAKMPHVLVAGATGMGKSVCINAILISILYKAKPDEVKFIMIDPKKVEFNGYNGIPHLLVPVVTDVKQAAGALMWAVEQMEKRYDLMEALEVRKLDAYNEKVRENPELGDPLPKIIIVIDELNDIMLQVRKPAEDLIMSIAQKARAAGIHLIIGTQRPSVDVITGVIKANIPSRISCKVASYNDSKTILEQAGAEKLLNNGDMLYIPAGAPKALRVQGAFVSDGEVASIMKFLKSQAKGDIYDSQALEEINRAAQKCSKGKGSSSDDFDDDDGDDGDSVGIFNDQQFLDAVDLAVKSGKISTSLIQRKLSIGYGKAAKFIDIMEEQGIVSEPNGQRPRDVLMTKDEWHELLSRRSLD